MAILRDSMHFLLLCNINFIFYLSVEQASIQPHLRFLMKVYYVNYRPRYNLLLV